MKQKSTSYEERWVPNLFMSPTLLVIDSNLDPLQIRSPAALLMVPSRIARKRVSFNLESC